MMLTHEVSSDLSEYEFDIPCAVCCAPGVIMSKGCSDPHYFAVCGKHHQDTVQNFEANVGKQCKGCHRPWWDIGTHYNFHSIRG